MPGARRDHSFASRRPVVSAPDIVIVGAGSTGCVVAARLAETERMTVTLLEAGPELGVAEPVPERLATADMPDLSGLHDWRYRVLSGGRTSAAPRGRVVGGSSAINTCIALRPEPDDFDGWVALGNRGWGWGDVLPYFKRLEADIDFPNAAYHGSCGPTPIVRWKPEELGQVSRAMQEAAVSAGHPFVADHNAPGSSGVGPAPMNRVGRLRVSAARYLDSVRRTRHLQIQPDTLVDRVLVERGRVVGLSVLGRQGPARVPCGQVVLCAGTYGTPAILLRSGIGPADQLRDLGILVRADLAGVGNGLSDHSQCYIAGRAGHRTEGGPCLQTLARFTTSGSKVRNDMQMCVLNRVDLSAYSPALRFRSEATVVFCVLLQHVESEGRVSLRSTDPWTCPSICLDYLESCADRARYRAGMRALWDVITRPAMDVVRDLDLGAAAVESDSALDAVVRARIRTAHHPAGTARMGAETDDHAVVDPSLRVHGVAGLFVADASVMPSLVRANTHVTCLMLGERAADIVASS